MYSKKASIRHDLLLIIVNSRYVETREEQKRVRDVEFYTYNGTLTVIINSRGFKLLTATLRKIRDNIGVRHNNKNPLHYYYYYFNVKY